MIPLHQRKTMTLHPFGQNEAQNKGCVSGTAGQLAILWQAFVARDARGVPSNAKIDLQPRAHGQRLHSMGCTLPAAPASWSGDVL